MGELFGICEISLSTETPKNTSPCEAELTESSNIGFSKISVRITNRHEQPYTSGRNLVRTIRPHNLIKISTKYLPSIQYTYLKSYNIPAVLSANVRGIAKKVLNLIMSMQYV